MAGKLSNIPSLHFPSGKPVSNAENGIALSRIKTIFESKKLLQPKDFDEVCRRIGLPVYAKRGVYEAVCQCSSLSTSDNPDVSFEHFTNYWNEMIVKNHDETSRFIFTLAVAKTGLPTRAYLEKEDFHSILYDILYTYPCLNFFIECTRFHPQYVDVVVVRIFWNVNRSLTGRITAHELRKSNFLSTLRTLEEVTEVDLVTDYFSYQHFYVCFSKFYDVDGDHDLLISTEDMKFIYDGVLTDRIIDRIFSTAVNQKPPSTGTTSSGPVKDHQIETIGFQEFVTFLLAKEDKCHPSSIQYWFRCVDLDGNGIISFLEVQQFHNDVVIEQLLFENIEPMEWDDVACRFYDIAAPENGQITLLHDLERCGLVHRFFKTLINFYKYLDQETSGNETESSERQLHVINLYRNNPVFNRFCTKLGGLQLIRTCYHRDAKDYMLRSAARLDNEQNMPAGTSQIAQTLVEYFFNNWVHGPCGQLFFSLYKLKTNRTSNYAEAYHSKQHYAFVQTKSSLGEWIVCFREKQNEEDEQLDAILNGLERAKKPTKKSVKADKKIKKAKEKFKAAMEDEDNQMLDEIFSKALYSLGTLLGYAGN